MVSRGWHSAATWQMHALQRRTYLTLNAGVNVRSAPNGDLVAKTSVVTDVVYDAGRTCEYAVEATFTDADGAAVVLQGVSAVDRIWLPVVWEGEPAWVADVVVAGVEVPLSVTGSAWIDEQQRPPFMNPCPHCPFSTEETTVWPCPPIHPYPADTILRMALQAANELNPPEVEPAELTTAQLKRFLLRNWTIAAKGYWGYSQQGRGVFFIFKYGALPDKIAWDQVTGMYLPAYLVADLGRGSELAPAPTARKLAEMVAASDPGAWRGCLHRQPGMGNSGRRCN